jgi:hypothetical protein
MLFKVPNHASDIPKPHDGISRLIMNAAVLVMFEIYNVITLNLLLQTCVFLRIPSAQDYPTNSPSWPSDLVLLKPVG